MAALSRSVIPWGYRRAHHGQGGADTEPLGRTLCAGDAVHRRRAGHREDIGSLLTACRKRSPGGSLAEVGDIGWMKGPETPGFDPPRRQSFRKAPLGIHPALVGQLEGAPVHAESRFCRSEEHTSELQSLLRSSYAVFCLKKKKQHH